MRRPSKPRRDDTVMGKTYHREERLTLVARNSSQGGLTRVELRAAGYVAVSKNSDLLKWGYQVIVWFNPSRFRVCADSDLYEYAPVNHGRQKHNLERTLPRMTARTLAEQQAVHRFIGVADADVTK